MKFLIIGLSLMASFIFIGCSDSSDDSPAVTTGSGNTTLETNQSSENDNNLNDDENDTSKPNDGVTVINQDEVQTPRTENMTIGLKYNLEKGDVVREIDNADIQVVRNSENDFYEVVLLSGKAQIIRK